MSLLLNKNPAELQNMRIEIVALLRTSFLQEEMKKSLMIILPYLPLERLEPIYQKLKEENYLHTLPHGSPTKKVKQIKVELSRIKHEAWKKAEEENTPPREAIDQEFLQKISLV